MYFTFNLLVILKYTYIRINYITSLHPGAMKIRSTVRYH
jgi:hypothetical protein